MSSTCPPHDYFDLLGVVSQRFERGAQRLVGDLEVSAARELLELDQRKVRFNAGRIAIHQQADRSCRGDDRCLGVSVAVLLAELQRAIPCPGRSPQ